MRKQTAPHIRTRMNTALIYPNVLIGLLPCVIAAVYYHGIRAFVLLSLSMLFSGLLDFLFVQNIRREKYVWEASSLVSGVVFALILPPDTPIWMMLTGVFVSVILVKQCFGGLGSNLFNPAFFAKAFLLLAFPSQMTAYSEPILSRFQTDTLFYGIDTGLNAIHAAENTPLFALFSGRYAGPIGTTCAVAILIGAVYLILTGLVRVHAPLAFFLALCGGYCAFFPMDSLSFDGFLRIVLSGGFLFVAIYPTGDYATTPITTNGRILFGIGTGLLTAFLLRLGKPEFAFVFPVLLMNAVTPVLDFYLRPRSLEKNIKSPSVRNSVKDGKRT